MNQKGFANIGLIIFGLLVLGAAGYFVFGSKVQAPETNLDTLVPNPASPSIDITLPGLNEVVSSPLQIKGTTKPGWVVFEAQAGTVTLYDGNGNKLGFAILRATGEWMKSEVDFEGTLVFNNPPKTGTGKLVFKDDNPKDESEAKIFEMPVKFASVPTQTRKIELFYYNKTRDADSSCSRDAVLSVEREIPVSMTPIQDAVNLLLKGNLSDTEKLAGFQTEFPLGGFSLIGANLKDGTLTLQFNDSQSRSGGGSCRVMLLWSQIAKTALQFSEVKQVRFEPEELFQP